ncbi:MAG: hypothetical protein JSU81_05605 [Candidatus Coatesbacteria bacterium]|nr:MAG: hypothetical protein JSU81_05605 [Candidatus Coatesbacteria bacterium]
MKKILIVLAVGGICLLPASGAATSHEAEAGELDEPTTVPAKTTAPAPEKTEAEANYYDDFSAAAKRIGKQLDKLGDLFAKASSGKNYGAECEDRAADLADTYHFLEEHVPPAEAVSAQRDLLASAELGAQAAQELAAYFDAEFRHKDLITRALDLYEQAVGKYADALEAAPVEM